MTLLTLPVKSTKIERIASYADVLENIYDVKKGDVIIATSNSGRNALVIEYLLRMKNKGVKIIGITSLEHSKTITSRHECGLRLFEVADIVLDNMAPHGDAGVALNEQIKMGPISTLTGCYLSQFIIGEMVELLLADGNDHLIWMVPMNITKYCLINMSLRKFSIKKVISQPILLFYFIGFLRFY